MNNIEYEGATMNNWHFPRTTLAQHYLNLLDIGISSSFAIVAPRRKGKTLFILQDLAPEAQKAGYVPVYASLWQNINAPQTGLIQALEEAIAALDKHGAFNRLFSTKIKKTAISNDLLGKMEIEFADAPTAPANQDLAYLDQLLSQLEAKAGKKRILLLVDEVQHLATSAQFNALTHTLRTMLDKRQGRVKSIFTGSSRHYMNLLFNESQSPFYHFVEAVPFPDLDEDFISFLRLKLVQDQEVTVSLPSLTRAFSSLDYSPYWMMKLVTRLITFRSDVDDALAHVLMLLEAAEDFEELAKRMKPIDRLIFLALSNEDNPFSKDIFARIDRECSVKGIPSNVQRSITRLSEYGLISQTHKGRYNIEKPGMKRYLSAS